METTEQGVMAERPNLGPGNEWAKPMDIGASDASYHSGVLKKLARRGLVDIKDASTKRPGCSKYYRAGCRYQINVAGIRALRKWTNSAKPARLRSSGAAWRVT